MNYTELAIKADAKLVERVIEMLDSDTKLREIDDHERIALSSQVNRLEKNSPNSSNILHYSALN